MIQIGTVIPDLPLVLGYKVKGAAGDKNQEEIFLEFGFAAQQSEIFKSAGYKDVAIKLVHLTLDELEGDWYLVKIEDQTTVNKEAVAAKYSRADINPGINVYDYDREVRKLRPTLARILLAATIAYTCGSVPGFVIGIIAVAIHGSTNVGNNRVLIGMSSIISCLLTLMIPYFRDKVLGFGAAFAGLSLKGK